MYTSLMFEKLIWVSNKKTVQKENSDTKKTLKQFNKDTEDYTEKYVIIWKVSIVQLDILLESNHPRLKHRTAEWNSKINDRSIYENHFQRRQEGGWINMYDAKRNSANF